MSDDTTTPAPGADPDEPPLADKVAVYLETVQARMDPGEFEALVRALREFRDLMEGTGEGSFDVDEHDFTPAVRQELLAVLAIVGTGKMEHRVVPIPGPDGGQGWAVVDASIADDPEKLAALQAELHAKVAEWDREAGIE